MLKLLTFLSLNKNTRRKQFSETELFQFYYYMYKPRSKNIELPFKHFEIKILSKLKINNTYIKYCITKLLTKKQITVNTFYKILKTEKQK